MYVIRMSNGLYVRKGPGINDFMRDFRLATWFLTREEATAAKPGHPREMGGSGYVGRVVKIADYALCERNYPTDTHYAP